MIGDLLFVGMLAGVGVAFYRGRVFLGLAVAGVFLAIVHVGRLS